MNALIPPQGNEHNTLRYTSQFCNFNTGGASLSHPHFFFSGPHVLLLSAPSNGHTGNSPLPIAINHYILYSIIVNIIPKTQKSDIKA